MKTARNLFVWATALLMLSTAGWAAKAPTAAERFRPLVDEYYLGLLTVKKPGFLHDDPNCPPKPDHAACVNAGCGRLRGYECATNRRKSPK